MENSTFSSVGLSSVGTEIDNTTTSFVVNPSYSSPVLIKFEEFEDRLEFIYTEESNSVYSIFPPIPAEKRVFKIIYSCVNGDWNKSDRVYGKIIPATEEDYEF